MIRKIVLLGLAHGRAAILNHNGGYLPDLTAVSSLAKIMYRARILVSQEVTPADAGTQVQDEMPHVFVGQTI
jgi:hypothetical protein